MPDFAPALKDLGKSGIEVAAAPTGGMGLALDEKGHVPLSTQFFPSARVYHSVAQAVANITFGALAFNSERHDNNEIHDTATNTSRLTCKTAGIYQIVGSLTWANAAGALRYASIKLNNTTFLAIEERPPVGGGNTTSVTIASPPYSLAKDDYVELIVYQDSGAPLNVNTTEFGMAWIGPIP